MRAQVALWLFCLQACSTPPPEPQPPAVGLEARCAPGNLLSGALADHRAVNPDAAPRGVRVCVWVLDRPLRGLSPPGAHTRTVVRTGTAQALGGHPTVLPGLRLAQGLLAQELLASQQGEPAAQLGAAVLPGATTTIDVTIEGGTAFGVRLGDGGRDTTGVLLLGTLEGGSVEQVLLDIELAVGGTPLALHLPGSQDYLGTLLLIQVESAPPDPEWVQAARASLQAAADEASLTAAAPTGLERLTVSAQLQQFRTSVGARARRPAILAAAERLEARRCADLVLVADDEALVALADELPPDLEQVSTAELTLALERAAFDALLPRLQMGRLPPALLAWSMRHAGTAGNQPAVLARVLGMATDCADLQRLLIEENLEALGSSDPGIREHAFHWLAQQGIAIAGFDPLGDRAGRRNALRAFLDRRQAAEVR